MYDSKKASLKTQQGVSLSGLIVVMGVIIAVAMLALKVIPSMLQYKSIKDGIVAAKNTKGTPQEMRLAFDKNADINAVTTLTGRDLMISKVNGETEVAFDYEQRIPLFTNVALVIHYAGTTDPTGVIPEKSDTPAK
jgi:hypothetical protein